MIFIYIYPFGDYYIGDWKDGKRHGTGEYHWASGAMYKGQLENGMKNGYGTYTFPDGTEKTGQWKDDKLLE